MWDRDNDAGYLFGEEVREKKRTASGVFHMTGKRGYVGVMRTPVDLLKANNKAAYKEYTKASECKVSNVFEDINNVPSPEELKAKDRKAAQAIIKAALEHHPLRALQRHWNFKSMSSIYVLFNNLGYPYEKKTYSKKYDKALPTAPPYQGETLPATTDQAPAQAAASQQKALEEAIIGPIMQQVQNQLNIYHQQAAPVKEENDGFQLKYSPKQAVVGKEIQDRVTNYMSILESGKKYDIKLIIREMPEDDNPKEDPAEV